MKFSVFYWVGVFLLSGSVFADSRISGFINSASVNLQGTSASDIVDVNGFASNRSFQLHIDGSNGSQSIDGLIASQGVNLSARAGSVNGSIGSDFVQLTTSSDSSGQSSISGFYRGGSVSVTVSPQGEVFGTWDGKSVQLQLSSHSLNGFFGNGNISLTLEHPEELEIAGSPALFLLLFVL